MPDLLGSIRKLLDALAEEPRTVTVTDPESGRALEEQPGAFDLQYVLASMLARPESFAVLPER